MKKYVFLFCVMQISISGFAQKPKSIKINELYDNIKIDEGQEALFKLPMKKNGEYTISVWQKGIDLVVSINDDKGTLIREQDTPNGKFGIERMGFSPDTTITYLIKVKPLVDSLNTSTGNYNVLVQKAPDKLKKIRKD